MTNEEEEFKAIFAYVEGAYPDARITDITPAAYWEHLRDLPMAAIRLGADRAMAGSRLRMPTAPLWRASALAVARTLGLGGGKALPVPEVSEAKRQEGLRRIQELIRDLARKSDVSGEDGR